MFPELFTLGGFTLYTYGLLLALAYVTAIFLSVWRAEKTGLEKKVMMDLALILLVAAILGAKLFYLFANWSQLMANPENILSLLRAGGVFQGGMITATVAGVGYLIWKKQPLWAFADVIAPAAALGQAIGRIGCFAAGCCYGTEAPELSWAVIFPPNAVSDAGSIARHPVQLYEALLMAAVFGFLMWLWSKRKFEGQVFWVYIIIYSLVRGGILEWFRGDNPEVVWGLHNQQVIAIFTLLVGAAVYWWLNKRANEKAKA